MLAATQPLRKGSLYIVGSGLRVGQSTIEAQRQIEMADKVLHLTADKETREWLKSLHGNVETLLQFYGDGKNRKQTYREMVDRILYFVRQNWRVCVVFYGHPAVLVTASHEAVRIAREEGFEAQMLPGVSAEDCVFADLGIDPGTEGCQTFQATRFLKRKNIFDPRATLLLWQVAGIGVREWHYPMVERGGMQVLVEYLLPFYGAAHEVVVYEAAMSADGAPKIVRMPLGELRGEHVTTGTTLVVPPVAQAENDEEMERKLAFA